MPIRGIDAFLELLHSAGVRHVFGNPGTTELPLNDALVADQRFRYILGLQEVPVMGMADGFAMASRSLGVVNLHICCGLGNAMGMLYNAYREGTPLLVTAGQQDRRLQFEEPILWGRMVEVVRPWTKLAIEVNRVEDLPSATRRLVQAALTPPTGPVFMSLPVDVQLAVSDELDLSPIRLPDRRVRPPLEALQRAATVLLGAKNGAILVGSRVQEADAVAGTGAIGRATGHAGDFRKWDNARPIVVSLRSSAIRPGVAAVGAGGLPAAEAVRRAVGGRHGSAAAVRVSRAAASNSRTHSLGASR